MSRGRRATPQEGEIYGETEDPLQVVFEVHDIPAERLIELDGDVEVAFRALFISNIRAEDPDLADVIPLSKVGLRSRECIDDRPHGSSGGISSGLCGTSPPLLERYR
jgi:hypothetical protein